MNAPEIRITAAQPLVADEDGKLEPTPVLSAHEASAEGAALSGELAAYWISPLDAVPAGSLGMQVERLLVTMDGFYTHLLTVDVAASHVCHDYLVRVVGGVEGGLPEPLDSGHRDRLRTPEGAEAEEAIFRKLRELYPIAPKPLPGEGVADYIRRVEEGLPEPLPGESAED